jgi:hypothetical protein
MLNGDDHTSLLVSFVNIPVRLGSLFQRIASIYDRFYLPCLNQFFDENQLFFALDRRPKDHFLAACQGSPQYLSSLLQTPGDGKISEPLQRENEVLPTTVSKMMS